MFTSISEIFTDAEHRMHGAITNLEEEFRHIRTGRANPAILDGINIDYYGTPTPVSQLANIATPEPRLITITPWDKGQVNAISKAILNSDLSLNPSNDGQMLRLVLPALTEERRKEFAKLASKKSEDGRIAIRNIRRDAIDHIKKLEKDHAISEDESKRAQEKIQKVTDDNVKKVDAVLERKVAEIMEV
jgi:ribosome recycling factor